MAKQIDARVQLKIDTEANWIANASSFRPKLGELIIYSPDEKYSSPRFKVGDGNTLLSRLPFSNGDLVMKNDTYSGWYNNDYIPKIGEIIIINSETADESAQVRIGDGSTLVKDLPVFGGASGSSANAQKLVNANGQGLNVATQGNRLVYFKDGIPTASNIYVYKTVPQDAVLTELATETEKGLLAPEEKVLLNELSEKAITKDNISSSLPTASETVKGGIMVGENLIIDNGVLSAVIPDIEEIEDATTTASGLMSAQDKVKLNNIEEGANKTVIDSTLSSTSTNPVENKAINSAISGLNSLISTSNQSTLTAAENFTKDQIAELIGSAPDTLNTLGEIADAMAENEDVVEALDQAIGSKANASDLNATSSKLDLHIANKNNPHEVSKAQVGLGNVENKSVATIKSEILTEENISALGFIKEVPETSAVTKVNGQTGEVTITAESIGALTSIPSQYVTQTQLNDAIPDMSNYVEKNGNKVLSTNDFTNTYKNKLDGIQDGATSVIVDTSLTSAGTNPVQGRVIYSALAGKQPVGDYAYKTDIPNTSSFVSTSRRINGYSLSSDINLNASDVGALPADTYIPNYSNATTTTPGIVKLSSEINTATNVAATPYAVYQAMDAASSAIEQASSAVSVASEAQEAIGTAISIAAGKSTVAPSLNGGTPIATVTTGNSTKTLYAPSATNYSLPTASSSELGGVKIGYSTNTNTKNYAVQLDASDRMYVNVPWTDTTGSSYTAGTGISISNNQINVKTSYQASGKNYAVKADANGNLYVNVPWTDTDTNTTYSGSNGIQLNGSTFRISAECGTSTPNTGNYEGRLYFVIS